MIWILKMEETNRIDIIITNTTGEIYNFNDIEIDMTLEGLRKIIMDKLKDKYQSIKLICNGRILSNDNKTLREHGIKIIKDAEGKVVRKKLLFVGVKREEPVREQQAPDNNINYTISGENNDVKYALSLIIKNNINFDFSRFETDIHHLVNNYTNGDAPMAPNTIEQLKEGLTDIDKGNIERLKEIGNFTEENIIRKYLQSNKDINKTADELLFNP